MIKMDSLQIMAIKKLYIMKSITYQTLITLTCGSHKARTGFSD